MEIDLRDKVVIVTGGGRGIGREIAATFARERAATAVVDLDERLLAESAAEFAANGWRGKHAQCDVRDANRVEAVVAEIEQEFGRIDVLVNNAGVFRGGPVESFSEADWDLSQDVNLKAVFLMSRAVIPTMKRQRCGRIINAASFAAIVPSIDGAAYAATKAGVVYFTRVLAGEVGPWGITVNCYAPGMIPTEMNHFADAPADRQQKLLDTLSLRQWGEAADVARLVCFLASDLAGYITGTLIDVSGGKLATQIPSVAYDRLARE